MRLGFALLTHDRPDQVIGLARLLRQLFPDAAIACHHDMGQSPLDPAALPDVAVVPRPHATVWGHSSVIDGALDAFALLRDMRPTPEWYYLLSAADLPIKSARRIRRDLEAAQCDVFIDHMPIPPGPPANRYFELRQFRYFADTQPPFPEGYICHAGEHWFTVNRRAIDWLLDHARNAPGLYAHYKALEATRHIVPEESFYQTLFCNAPQLVIRNENLRHIDWSRGAAHPRTLSLRDLPRILRSRAHFARKIDPERSKALIATATLLLRAGS